MRLVHREFAVPIGIFLALYRLLKRGVRLLWSREDFRGLAGSVMAVVLGGAAIFKAAEPKQFATWTDAIYFAVVTLTTVGYGDFAPTRALTKWVVIVYIFLGLGIMGAFLGIVGEAFVEDARAQAEARKSRRSPKDPPDAP